MLPAHFYNADGELKPFHQRQAERQAATTAAAHVARQVAERSKRPESQDAAVQRLATMRITELQDRLRGSLAPDERSRLSAQLAVLKTGQAKVKARIADQSRIDALSANRLVQLARDSADCLERSWQALYPHANEADVMLAVALARRNDLEPDDLHREFKAVEQRIAAGSLAIEQQRAADAGHAALKAQSEAAESAVKASEAQLRLAQVQGASNGSE